MSRSAGGSSMQNKSVSKLDGKSFSARSDFDFPIVGVGASAGGLEAFQNLLKALPPDLQMAFIFVQHLDPAHPSTLASILSKSTEMPVIEVTESLKIEPAHVYIIPSNSDLRIDGNLLKLSPRTVVRGQHMPINSLLASLAKVKSENALGVILSGSGADGALGIQAIKAEGGITFAQDETAK